VPDGRVHNGPARHGLELRAGDDWQCERGFMKRADACAPVEVPVNAYLDSTGKDWRCERGFGKENSACVALNVPTNAYLDYSGNEWRCMGGYRKQGKSCLTDQ